MKHPFVVIVAQCLLALSLAAIASAQEQSMKASDVATALAPPPAAKPQGGTGAGSEFKRQSFELHIGGLVPGGDLQNQFAKTVFTGLHYGYRFHRNFQADFGVDFGFGSARVNDTVQTTGGRRNLRDTEVFVPLGLRLILPAADDRLLLSVGGGVAFAAYGETVQARTNEVITCRGCVSRSGTGAYALVQLQYLFGVNRRFGMGITARSINVTTRGGALGATALAAETKDRWANMAATFSVHF